MLHCPTTTHWTFRPRSFTLFVLNNINFYTDDLK
jgi:hypothetical protein